MERSDEPESVQRSARMRRSREQGAPDGGTTAASRLRTSEELIRQLATRLETAREDERRVLARELHDELGQTLTAIKLELARIITLFKQDRIYPGGIDRLQALVGLAEIGMTTVRRLTTDLRLAALDHVELSASSSGGECSSCGSTTMGAASPRRRCMPRVRSDCSACKSGSALSGARSRSPGIGRKAPS
jgi:signal transduction histidine kinase